jgi:hypothetical protein
MRFSSNTDPSAGRPWARASAILIMIAVLAVWVWIEATPPERVPPGPGQAVAIDKSPTAQQQRKAVIDKLLADGLLRRIEVDAQARVRASLRPGFYMLDEPTRRDYAQIIYAYYFDGSNMNDVLVLRDGRNGNEVGQYNPYRDGLSMYK